MQELLGEEYQAFEASCHEERVQGLRFSRLKFCEGSDGGKGPGGEGAETAAEEKGCLMGGSRKEEPDLAAWAAGLAAQFAQRTGFSLRPIPWVKEGFYYGSQDRPGRHPCHEAGLYYIQEPSAMAVVELLDPQPGDWVLDLCGAPGGKSSHIASRLEGRGFLLSNEIHPARAKILSRNIERMGVRNCVVCNEEPARLASRFPAFFDKIVVDAPCSGEGMFRKDEGAGEQWSEEHVRMCAARQGEILASAAVMLKPGGRMVYSTCTFAPEENEGTIMEFLEGHRDFYTEKTEHYEGFIAGKPQWAGYGREGRRVACREAENGRADLPEDKERLQLELLNTLRIMPHKLEGEGHFMAVLRKEEAVSGEQSRGRAAGAGKYLDQKRRNQELKDYRTFLTNTLREPEVFLQRKEYVLFGEQLYLVPVPMPDMTGLKVVRPGLHMGALKKNRFEPSHALALALSPGEVNVFCDLSSGGEKVLKYLRGEIFSPEGERWAGLERGKGWALICVDGLSLGWCKLAGGALKNHYPKGLRWN